MKLLNQPLEFPILFIDLLLGNPPFIIRVIVFSSGSATGEGGSDFMGGGVGDNGGEARRSSELSSSEKFSCFLLDF